MREDSRRIMQYPPDFVKEVKNLFPANTELHKALDAGSPIVGRFLDDNVAEIKPQQVLNMFDPNDHLIVDKLFDLRKEAQRLVRIGELYQRFLEMVRG